MVTKGIKGRREIDQKGKIRDSEKSMRDDHAIIEVWFRWSGTS